MRRLGCILMAAMMALGSKAQLTTTWVATDALGRTLPSAQENPLKRDGKPRTVGIFYITWHTQGLHNGLEYKCDVSKVLNEDPTARLEWDNKAWTGPSYHWGEPEYGYFLSQDKYVIKHDLSMLADAGVDVLIMDVTNAVLYWDEWEVLFSTMQEMKKDGNKVPQFCFWAFNGNVITVVQSLYDRYYKTGKYQDCWFYWDGKPLLLYNATPSIDANPNGGEKNLADYSDEVKQFFTLRNMWWGYYKWAGERYVGQEDKWSFGYELGDEKVKALSPNELCSRHEGRMEEMAVTPAQHPMSIVGKSWRRETGEPSLDDHDMPVPTYCPAVDSVVDCPTQYGIYFQDRWNEALDVDPEFIYLNDWNEWTAGRYRSGKDPSGQAAGPTSFLGRENPFYFVDQYNAEFNRSIAPMKGGWTDNYYMQMVQNIRRYKGVDSIPVFRGLQKVIVDGSLQDWPLLTEYFADTRGDVIHRDHDGYGNLHYTDQTGRNDIVRTHMAVDKKNVYFAVETDQAITSYTDPNWMLLFLNTDQSTETGWQGYDFIINRVVKDAHVTTLMQYDEEKEEWTYVCDLSYAVEGNVMEIAVPRKVLGLNQNEWALDLKWADNPTDASDIISLCTTGDTAPNRRFAYRYIWKK